jgi:hypothetical protein
MRAIFEDRLLSGQVAMRGGTVLHKVHLAPAARYSEDTDLVAVGDRPEGNIRKALLRVLRPVFGARCSVLGRERSSVWDSVQLAVRNGEALADTPSLRPLHAGGRRTGGAERIIAHLRQCLADRAAFCTDIDSFVRRNLAYDPDVAGAFIERHLLGLLPE